MDPDVIFIILLYITMLVLTVGSIIGLSKKIWRHDVPIALKLFVIGLLVGLLILALVKFNGVESGEVQGRQFYISRWDIMIYSASFLIGLNWSINIVHRQVFQRIKLPSYLKVTIMTIVFSVLIPTIFYFSANLFEKLNIMGSGG
jgi:hypothetical protein